MVIPGAVSHDPPHRRDTRTTELPGEAESVDPEAEEDHPDQQGYEREELFTFHVVFDARG
ncbi:hypothetical protein GCM10010302_30370 [Streptomyces polychromogenes]|uniref:Uncharacterized protein n=1 Tax=Streptomyces polychromogenes TaxID=67342 RepID=A0ABP3F0Z6_9ACTN